MDNLTRDARLLTLGEVKNAIISAIEESDQGEQDPIWIPIHKALEKLADLDKARQPCDKLARLDDPCPHPARNGVHEIYGNGTAMHCRACGAGKEY